MDRVVICGPPTTVIFRSLVRRCSDDPYVGESFVVEVLSGELNVAQCVFMFGVDWTALAGFFADIAQSWKGWSGEKVWHSIESDLEISATNDLRGHCTLSIVIRNGPVGSWAVSVSGIEIDVGEDLANLSRQISEWVGLQTRRCRDDSLTGLSREHRTPSGEAAAGGVEFRRPS